MWLNILLVLAVLALLLVLAAPLRLRFVEGLKSVSDDAVTGFLRASSRFGSELTEDGLAEQHLWREQRLRYLHALKLRASQRTGRKGA